MSNPFKPLRNEDKDSEQDGPREFRFPDLHTWKLRRLKLPGAGAVKSLELEEFIIEAHGITMTERGVVFQRFYLDPVTGPQPLPIRAFADYYDYEDITPTAEPSRIIQ